MKKILCTILITINAAYAFSSVIPKISFDNEYKDLYVEIVGKLQDRHYKSTAIDDIFSKK